MRPDTNAPTSPSTCFDCDAPLRTEWCDHSFPYGADDPVELSARIPMGVCNSCGSRAIFDEGAQLKHEAVCAHHGVLTPREIRAIRENHGLSRAAFAKLTGLGEATLHRWENALLIQNPANDRYLRLLRSGDSIQKLRQLAARPDASVRREHPGFRFIEASIRQTFQLRASAFSYAV